MAALGFDDGSCPRAKSGYYPEWIQQRREHGCVSLGATGVCVSHEEIAAYWYDADHDDCSILRQGDVFLNFREDGGDYLVVVSQSCNLRDNPSLEVTLARADEIATYVAENGNEITELEFFRKGYPIDRFMLPRRPGHIETELLVFLDELKHVAADEVCAAVQQGFAKARATDILTAVVGDAYGHWVNRPAVRRTIPTFDWLEARTDVAALLPDEAPLPTRPIELTGKSFSGKPGSAREGEVWYRVGVKQHEPMLSSTTPSVEMSRAELAEQLQLLLDDASGLSPKVQRALDLVRKAYYE